MIYSEDIQDSCESTVLLLIIPNPTSQLLTHSVFYKLFSQYGDVEKILIFEKSRIWKAFVEMATVESAVQAQMYLNGTNLQNDSYIYSYFSTFKTVTFVNNNSGGVDYRQLRQKLNPRSSPFIQVHSQPEINLQVLNTGLAYYNPHIYPHTYSQSDEQCGPRSETSLDDFKYMFESLNEKKQIAQEQLTRSRSSTQTNSTKSTVRKKLRLLKEDSNVQTQNTGRLHSLFPQNRTTPNSIDFPSDFQGMRTNNRQGFNDQASSYSDTSLPLHIPLSTQEDDLFDLINANNNEDQKEEIQYPNEDLQEEDRDIMNAFNDKQTFGFMFSIPEVQVETSSPITKGQRVRRLQDFDFEDFVQPTASDSSQYCEDLIDPSNYVNPQFLIENQPSKVIYIRGLQSPELIPKHLFNLFSNCGNIMVIIFIRHKYSALIQFQQLVYAQNAKDNLNNLPFFGSKLKIFYSNYQEIQLPLPHSNLQTQVYLPAIEQNRFGEGKNLVFNPPGQVLHISNIQKEASQTDKYLKNLFTRVGQVQQIKFMHVKKSKHMALIKMGSLEEALNASAELHGHDLFGRNINISFTKSKL